MSAAPAPTPSEPVSTARRALSFPVAVLPGALAHGSGHYALGQPRIARQLLLLEGVGLGLILLGGGSLVLTGASRYAVGPSVATTVAGFGFFSVSWFADLYGVANHDAGAASARRVSLPWIETELGYRYVQDSQFAYRHFATQRLSVGQGAFRASPAAWFSLAGDHARYELELSYRFVGSLAGELTRDHTRAEVSFGLIEQRFRPEGFQARGATTALAGRYDLRRVGETLAGAFAEWQVGVGALRYDYDLPGLRLPSDIETFLLARFGMGVALRGPSAPGSEVVAYYDHRHDDFAAGLKMTGLGSGAGGHFGLGARWFFDSRFGAGLDAQVGSARILGASLLFHEEGPRAVTP